jgi:DSF synthase
MRTGVKNNNGILRTTSQETVMDMQIPDALLRVTQTHATHAIPGTPAYAFSKQLSAQYDSATHALWVRWQPVPRPCFNPGLLRALSDCARLIEAGRGTLAWDGARVPLQYTVLASGTPGVFNLGGDLDLFLRHIAMQDRAGLVDYGKACIHVLYRNYVAHGLPLTTISLVQGDCLGGGFEAALSSDIVIAERHARFGFPEILFNLFPGMGAYSFLERRVGRRPAEEIIATGKIYSADDMLAMGVIDSVVESGQGAAQVDGLIERLRRSRNGLQGLAAARRRVNRVTHEELVDVVELWADCALRLTPRDLKLMQRLVSRQTQTCEASRDEAALALH